MTKKKKAAPKYIKLNSLTEAGTYNFGGKSVFISKKQAAANRKKKK